MIFYLPIGNNEHEVHECYNTYNKRECCYNTYNKDERSILN